MDRVKSTTPYSESPGGIGNKSLYRLAYLGIPCHYYRARRRSEPDAPYIRWRDQQPVVESSHPEPTEKEVEVETSKKGATDGSAGGPDGVLAPTWGEWKVTSAVETIKGR